LVCRGPWILLLVFAALLPLGSCRSGPTRAVTFAQAQQGVEYRVTLGPEVGRGRLSIKSNRDEPVLVDKFKYHYNVKIRQHGEYLVFPDPAINVRGPEGHEWVVLGKGDEASWSLEFASFSKPELLGSPLSDDVALFEYHEPRKGPPEWLRKHASVLSINGLELIEVRH